MIGARMIRGCSNISSCLHYMNFSLCCDESCPVYLHFNKAGFGAQCRFALKNAHTRLKDSFFIHHVRARALGLVHSLDIFYANMLISVHTSQP
jgi:hypothetical protein